MTLSRCLFLAACLMAVAGCRSAPEFSFPPHPRVAWTQAELDAWKADPGRADALRRAIDTADAILARGLTIPEREGQWIFYYACPDDDARLKDESPEKHVCPKCARVFTDERTVAAYRTVLNYQLDNDLYNLGLAYALTGTDAYAAPVRDALLRLVDIYPRLVRHDRWGRTGILAIVGGRRYCQHLDEGIAAMKLARAYDLCVNSPLFSAADRTAIEQGFLARTAHEIRDHAWMMQPRNNHQTWFNATYAVVGLAIGDRALLDAAFHADHGLLWQLGASVTDEGLWYEGTIAYHFYALSAIQETLEAGQRVGWTFADRPRLKSLWTGPLQFAYPDGSFPVINDSDPASLKSRRSFYEWAAVYFADPSLPAALTARQPLASAALPGAGLVALRRGAADRAVCAFLDYGIHGDHHGHPDKLNFTLYAFGRELVLDPGRLSYSVPEYESWARTTAAHNTLVIDARNQQPDEGSLIWFEDNDRFVATLVQSTGAYPGWTLRRLLVLTHGYLLDVLTAAGPQPATLDLFLHARGALRESGESAEPLGQAAGYQHLSQVVRHPPGRTAFTFDQPGNQALAVHTWPPADTWSGLGIGYHLRDQVPFLLRRVHASQATLLTVYDLTDESTLRLGEVTQAGAVLTVPLGSATLRLDLDQPSVVLAAP